MKFTWDADDIKPGRTAKTSGSRETWVIGYFPHIAEAERFVLVSLIDGIVTVPESKEGLATLLTSGMLIPTEYGYEAHVAE